MSGLIESKRDYTADVAVSQSRLNAHCFFTSPICYVISADMLRIGEIRIIPKLTDSFRSHWKEIAAEKSWFNNLIYQSLVLR